MMDWNAVKSAIESSLENNKEFGKVLRKQLREIDKMIEDLSPEQTMAGECPGQMDLIDGTVAPGPAPIDLEEIKKKGMSSVVRRVKAQVDAFTSAPAEEQARHDLLQEIEANLNGIKFGGAKNNVSQCALEIATCGFLMALYATVPELNEAQHRLDSQATA